ncbi:STAS/SEC14 domain-containing protein [Neolewinella lacunae]|uniref:STAS/SEC14 domain-containing protein n=1 Tax=Neolewinella lacunae TaxID=1517758 RepID=A0A923TD57_9BACT|nr:STAS/SEC14 domain-containing protein [Neolewinella lacunae]MBC6994467.1 STAS/SEC14 domain-containing protein [Neolewinella lacunae]MDN3634160.1 STAS/SEC14 domain-containing protein [Neolewinella lacunae]
MISVFPLSQSNLLGFTLDGEVDEEGIRKLMMAVEAKVLTHGKLRLLGNIKSVGGFQSFQTFWNTLRTKKELWDKIEKYAILTDHAWLTTLTGSIDWLTPRMEIKTFALNEGELAHAWLKIDPTPQSSEALTEIDLGDTRLLGLAIVGKMQVADYDRINTLIEEQAAKFGQARIMLEVVNTGFSGQALLEDIKAGIKNYKNVERMAIIGDQAWLKTTVKLGDLLTPGLELAAFSTTERKRAIAWLS